MGQVRAAPTGWLPAHLFEERIETFFERVCTDSVANHLGVPLLPVPMALIFALYFLHLASLPSMLARSAAASCENRAASSIGDRNGLDVMAWPGGGGGGKCASRATAAAVSALGSDSNRLGRGVPVRALPFC